MSGQFCFSPTDGVTLHCGRIRSHTITRKRKAYLRLLPLLFRILHTYLVPLWNMIKGTVLLNYIYLEVILLNRSRLGHVTMDIKIFVIHLLLIFKWSSEFLSTPHKMITILFFLWKSVCVGVNLRLVSTCRFP
jgi:hypothetical protein